jgi:hypothetical protein
MVSVVVPSEELMKLSGSIDLKLPVILTGLMAPAPVYETATASRFTDNKQDIDTGAGSMGMKVVINTIWSIKIISGRT